MRNLRRTAVALIGAAVASLALAVPAQATTDIGTWWTNQSNCYQFMININTQGRYTNSSGGGNAYTRGDGFYATTGSHYLKKVTYLEYMDGVLKGSRTINYALYSTSTTVTDIPVTYMPPMLNTGTGRVTIQVWDTAGLFCQTQANIGQ